MAHTTLTPLGAVIRGAAAGVAGTALMTAAQLAYYKATGAEPSSTPGEVGKRVVEGVLHREAPPADSKVLNEGMHWFYGSSWGIPYGIVAGSRREPAPVLRSALALGLAVWGGSLVQLPAMKLSPPLWEMPAASIAPDVGFHLVYGLGGAIAFRALRG